MKLTILAVAGAAFAGLLSPAVVSASRYDGSAGDFAGRVLASHNRERAHMGMSPLRWSPRLSDEAGQWAASLARRGAFEHSQDDGGTGENLWMGSANRYSPEQMIGTFISERSAFRPGRFPHVSKTGNWSDVGHYTQLIWPETQEVGCAISRSGGKDVLVCRYWPEGNVYGERVG